MAFITEEKKKHLLEYLPAIYQEPGESGEASFLSQFLLAFEKVLLGHRGAPSEGLRWTSDEDRQFYADLDGLGEKIARLHTFFDPGETPEEFLPWLSAWAALTLRADMSSVRKRKLLANIFPLYRIRGTRKYLEELLTLCLETFVSVTDAETPALQLDRHSTIGIDAQIGGGPPHFFRVLIIAPKLTHDELDAQSQIARDIIELAKPVHTYYEMEVGSPQMQLGMHSTVGLDTVLGPTAVQ
jgi:phage tail-like protein